ncbi:MAG: sigma-70 family RNA polymerase sigma factor [Bacteroidales bacterium]|nr:sigma-70 family RNA polymerase sigma factor [Bacteroidales bacterium]MCF6341394.1 sigma-70 family RNA polymerase sigma factor [Bacteroidales bacterium]
MREIASEKILQGIIDNDSEVIQYIYDKYFESIKGFVIKHSGTKEDAWDVFQDGIIVIYEQIKNNKLALKNTFHTYFFTICKYTWLKVLRERDKKYYEQIESSKEIEQISLYDYKLELDELIEKEKRVKLYNINFQKISVECQKLLKLIAKGYSIQEIADSFSYKSVGFAYKKSRICKERLIKLIQKDLPTPKTKNK